MNRTYRLVWNEGTQRYVPAAESTRARGKGGGCKVLKRLGAVLVVASLGVSLAEANPSGGTVTSGKGNISQSGSTTTVTQQSQDLSLNWARFSIAAAETVRFVQPSSTAVALNRVTGTDPSQIYGHLQSNGQVFLLNPNGVLFGPGAEVNVGALVASTQNLSDADFRAGHYQFTAGGTTGTVDNQGHLTASPGGYLALLGPKVSNNGAMKVTSGTVLLAAGNKVSLQLNNGSLVSYSIDQGALHALAENNQLIQADGGRVYLSAQGANAVSTAVVNNTGIIEARTVDNHGGVIRLLGDTTIGQENVAGTLDASAPYGGNGGTVETSAAQVTVADTARITTATPAGKTGTWSLNEADFTVAASGGDIKGATLGSELATTSVTITTTSGNKSGHGDIVLDDAVSWSTNTTLTLNAARGVQINSSITATGNTAGLVLNYGFGDDYAINGGQVTLSGNHPSLSIDGHAYTVINDLGWPNDWSSATLQGISNDLDGYYALGSNIDASATGRWFYSFNPLGTSDRAFTGQFAGLGHVISNLTIDAHHDSGVGLFGVTGTASVIRDVGLVGGSVSGGSYVGPLVGFNQGEILNSYAAVSTHGRHRVGGLVGENSGTISGSYATGAVDSHREAAGGLVGVNDGTIIDSYATGSVTARHGVVGGLVGENTGEIIDTYAAGAVTGWYEAGGLVGYNAGNGCDGGTVTNSFWDKTTSGQVTSDGGIGMTTAQMQMQANFTSATGANHRVNPAWDFSSVWMMYDGSTYPLLKRFLKPIVITANNVSAVYTSAAWNGSDTYTCSTGNCAGLLGTVKYSGPAADAINVGNYSIVLSGLYSTQQGYAITYAPGQLTITPASLTLSGISAASRVYDGTTTAVLSGTAKVTPLGTDRVTVVGTGSGTFTDKNVGTNKAVTVSGYALSGAAAGNYTLVEPTGLTANITPASLIVTGLSASNKVYDSKLTDTLSGTAKVTPLGTDSVTVIGTGSGTFADKNVGTGKAVTVSGYSLGGADARNYVLVEPASLTANITPATLAITGVTANNKVYDTTVNDTLSGTATVTALGSDNVFVVGTGTGTFGDKNVGNNKAVTVSGYRLAGSDAGNYTLVEPAGLKANITPASLALTGISANNKVYDTTAIATLAGTPTVSPLGADHVTVVGTGTGVFANKNVGTDKLVTVSGYTLSGADAGNYTLVEPTNVAATISRANLLINGLTVSSKIYDATTAATLSGTAAITPLGKDSVTLGGTGKAVFTDKNVGTGKVVTLGGYTLNGADAGNYNLVEPTGLTANITPAALRITGVTANSKVYDTTTYAELSGTATVVALGSDNVFVVGSGNGTFADKNVGNNKAVTVSGYSLVGFDAGNYRLVEPTGLTASITPASLALTGISANNKVYDGTVTASLSGTPIITALGGDSVAVAGTGKGVFGDKNAGTDKPVTVSGYTLSGADAGNYTLVEPTDLTANVAPALLTVTASNATKVDNGIAYSGGNGVTYSGFVPGESANSLGGTLTYGGTSQGAVHAGSYTIIPGGLSSSNYDITFVNGILTVSPPAPAVAANEVTKLLVASAYNSSQAGAAATSSGGTLPSDESSRGGAGNTVLPAQACGGQSSEACSIGYVDGVLTIEH